MAREVSVLKIMASSLDLTLGFESFECSDQQFITFVASFV